MSSRGRKALAIAPWISLLLTLAFALSIDHSYRRQTPILCANAYAAGFQDGAIALADLILRERIHRTIEGAHRGEPVVEIFRDDSRD